MSRFYSSLAGRKYGIMAFLAPFAIRSIPELIVGPYPVGFDTIAYYVPITMDWAAGKAGAFEILGTAPLLYMISVPIYLLLRADPILIFKVLGPVLYGSMTWALFRFLKKGLGWKSTQSLGATLLVATYFVTLRIGWDLYRNMLGLTFILLSLSLLTASNTRAREILMSLLMVLAVASDQLTGVIILVIVAWRVLRQLVKRSLTQVLQLVRIGTPAALLFAAILFAWLQGPVPGLVQSQSQTPSIDNLWNSVGFLGFLYLPLVPLILTGVKRLPSSELRVWAVFCLGALLATLAPFVGLTVMSYRWSLLLAVPCGLWAATGARQIVESNALKRPGKMFPVKGLLSLMSVALLVSGALYVALPAQSAIQYYTAFPAFLPTSMIQSSVPFSDMSSVRAAFTWLQTTLNSSTILVTHQAFYGWARAYLPSRTNILNYGYGSLTDGVQAAVNAGFSNILTVWWINGTGWYGQTTIPRYFFPLYRTGEIAVYAYVPS